MTKTHFDNLLYHTPNLPNLRIIDIGSGRGKFLVEAKKRGCQAVGLEYNPEYIKLTDKLAAESGVAVVVTQGVAESMPYSNEEFEFANMCELIEHVENPHKVLAETYRILMPGGRAYISVPNRFGFKDPHFHLYFVNYLPRFLSGIFIGIFGRHKNYTTEAGRQKLTEMHYFTYGQITNLAKNAGFNIVDIRLKKLNDKIKNPLINLVAKFIYFIARQIYFNTFHLLLIKP